MQRSYLRIHPIIGVGAEGEYPFQLEDYFFLCLLPNSCQDEEKELRTNGIYLKIDAEQKYIVSIRLNKENKILRKKLYDEELYDFCVGRVKEEFETFTLDQYPALVEKVIALCGVGPIDHAHSIEGGVCLDSLLARMQKQINDLIEYAKKVHHSNNLTDNKECVTLLAFNEFSFYTEQRPIPLNQYKKIISSIKEKGNSLPHNVYIIFSSFPVLLNETLYNAVLFLESGKKNKLYSFVKTNRSSLDLLYFNSAGVPYKLADDKNHSFFIEALKDTAINSHSKNQYQGAIKVKTSRGKSFFIITEICLEHKKKKGMLNLRKLTQQLQHHHKFIPKHAIHVITSNSVTLRHNHLVSPTYIHADPYRIKNIKHKRSRLVTNFFGNFMLHDYPVESIQEIYFLNFPYEKELKAELNDINTEADASFKHNHQPKFLSRK